MEQLKLSDSLSLSKVIAGFMRVSKEKQTPQEILRFVEICLEKGVTAFDHADIYGNYQSEGIFGECVLQKRPELRSSMQLITKAGIVLPGKRDNHILYYDSSRSHILQSVETSLSRLRTDHIDLLLLHRPDPLGDPAETARALEDLRASGTVREFGVSNHTALQVDTLQSYLPFPLVTNQVELSLKTPGCFFDGTTDHAFLRRMPLLAWSPLGGGALFESGDERAKRIRAKAELLAERYELGSWEQILYAWLLVHPVGIGVVTGTMKIERMELAVEALSVPLSRVDWYQLLEASRGYSVP